MLPSDAVRSWDKYEYQEVQSNVYQEKELDWLS